MFVLADGEVAKRLGVHNGGCGPVLGGKNKDHCGGRKSQVGRVYSTL